MNLVFDAARRARVLARFELADTLRSRWLVFTTAVYAIVFGAFVWLGLRESSVLGFTGLSRVVLNISNAVVIAVPLVALVASGQSIVRARSGGSFELLLTQPCRRGEWLFALIASRVAVVVGPLLLLFALALVLGRDESALAPMVIRSALVTVSLAWAFIGLGVLLSSLARTPERATVYALCAWLAGAALHDFALIGALLQWQLSPRVVFALAAMNPVEAARIAILSGVDPDLSVLGPVGFWIANTLGPSRALLVGVGWPLALGSLCIGAAAFRLRRSDLVG